MQLALGIIWLLVTMLWGILAVLIWRQLSGMNRLRPFSRTMYWAFFLTTGFFIVVALYFVLAWQLYAGDTGDFNFERGGLSGEIF